MICELFFTTTNPVVTSNSSIFSYNYRVTVVEDACFDRSQASHAMSLCDMHMKYADVVPGAEVLKYIEAFRTNLRASA